MKPFPALLALTFFAFAGMAQTVQIRSPEILTGNQVIFRLVATNAQNVSVFADWMKAGNPEPMKKGESNVWSATVGPVEPGVYVYHFTVDGLNIADPVNPKVKLRARSSASLLEVPGKEPGYWEYREVPHGTVQINYHKSAIVGPREVWVYTPPGYEKDTGKRYPVLYLLHGSNDTPAGWTMVGRANFTMDSLLAEGQAREMIIVTPFGHATPFEARDGNTEKFTEYLLREVMPLIEGKYRTAGGRENRAIAGFSMGGGHALHIGLNNLDLFGAVAALSPGVPRDFETQFATLLEHPETTNKKLKLFWIGCGKDDFLFDAAEKLSATLTKHGIEHVYRATEGAHTFNVWREYFHEFAPLLFRAPK